MHAEAALALSADYGPDNFYLPEMWCVAAWVALGSGREEAAREHVAVAQRWVRARLEHDVPPACHESFLRCNPVNAELATLAARLKP